MKYFYPGAKVDTKAYEPIVSKLAEYFKSEVWQKVFQGRKLYGKGNSGRKLGTVWKLRKTVR